MRIIPKASKVKTTFYKGITISDIVIGILSLAVIAVTLSSNFPFRIYVAIGILCLTIPLYLTIGSIRLYIQIAYLFKYLFSRKRYRERGDKAIGIESILPYREVKENLIYNKDSSLVGIVEIEPMNFGMLSEERQNAIIDGAMSRILNSIETGEELFLAKIDEPLVLDDRIQEELQRIDKLNGLKEKGILNERECEKRADVCQSRIQLLDSLNSDEIQKPGYYLCLLGFDHKVIEEQLSRAIEILSEEGIRSHRLKDQELLHYLARSYGEDADSRNPLVKIPAPKKATFYPMSIRQDRWQISEFAINKYPLSVPNGWAERLFSMEGCKVTLRAKPIEKDKAIHRIDSAILEVESKNFGKESELLESDYQLDSLRELLEDIQQSNQMLFDVVLIVTVYDRLGENRNRRKVKQTLNEMGFGYSEMVGRQLDAYVSSLLSTRELTKESYGIQTGTLAASFPFQGEERNEAKGMFLGGNGLPSFIDFFKRDVTHVNSNMVIIGQSGSGKSYAAKTVLGNLSSDGAKIFVLDPEAEYGALAKSLGGVVIDASNGLKQRINPFQVISASDEENGNSYYAHLQFLEQFYRVVLPGINADALEMLNKLTQEMYHFKNIDSRTDFGSLENKDYPTFDDLSSLVKKKLGEANNSYDESCLRIIQNYVTRFAKGGRDSALWNGYTTFSPKENFVDIDFQKLIANHNDVTSNAQMLLLLRWMENEIIQNRERNRAMHMDRKIVVCIDEAHLFIDEKYPIALDFMHSLAKRIRKYDGMLLLITQNVKDFAGTPETERKSMAIINVSQYSMIFNLSPNDMSELLKLYENSGGFNETEKDFIIHSSRGECFLISSPSERGSLYIEATDYMERTFDR